MTSLLALILNDSPVPLAPRRAGLVQSAATRFRTSNKTAELDTMAQVSTLHKIITKRASSVAQTEWRLYRAPRRSRTATTETDERDQVDTHLALDVWEQPNPFQARTNFLKRWSMHIDLTGEAYILPTTGAGMAGAPTELWQAQPDRMTPRPHPTEFLVGWEYRSPDGETIPLNVGEVWQFQDPDPTNPYRGMSPIKPLMVDIDAARHGAEWNRNFFLNSAEPGGIIEAAEGLTDDEFEDLARRWNEQHQGTHNAHRVAVIEHGKWVDRAFSMRDMQFTQLRDQSRDLQREAFAMSKVMLGIGESVNRATAQAAWAIYLEQEIRGRLDELKMWLNRQYLPRFGRTAQGLEFDYVDPVPTDNEAANAELEAKSSAAAALVAAGYDPEGVLHAVGLPPIDTAAPAPTTAPPGSMRARFTPRAQDEDDDEAPDVDISRLQDTFERSLTALLAAWATAEGDQKAALVDQVRAVIQTGQTTALADLAVDSTATAALLEEFMVEMADDGSDAIVEEARAQGVTVEPVEADRSVLRDAAIVVAGLVAARLAASASSTAMRANTAGATATDVADAVAEGLAGLSTDGPKPQLAGALTGSQNEGRMATLQRAPTSSLYASEVNDSNTCGPCARVDGQRLGSSDDFAKVRSLYPGAGFGGYIDCEGRERCRGTVVAKWD